jgi:hypothetical protein
MMRPARLFCLLVALFHRSTFLDLVYRHQAERCAKGSNSRDLFSGMLFCQLAQWIDTPFDLLSDTTPSVQYHLPLKGIGQHQLNA